MSSMDKDGRVLGLAMSAVTASVMRRWVITIAVIHLVACLPAKAFSDIVIEVDVSDPTSVVFRATGAAPIISDSSAWALYGVTLKDLLTVDAMIFSTITGSLAAPNVVAYDELEANANPGNTPLADANDINLAVRNSHPNTLDFQQFSTGSPAFTGVSTANLSLYSLQSPGFVGDVIAGNGVVSASVPPSNAVIGQYRVTATAIPEPTPLKLLGVVGLLLAAVKRYKVRR